MKPKHPALMIYTTSAGHSVMVFDLADEEAITVAADLARCTGRSVSVTDEILTLIETIPATSVH